MTPAQRVTLGLLKSEGFVLDVEIRDIVRVSRFGSWRLILPDGTQKRGHQQAHQQDQKRQQRGSQAGKKPVKRRG